MDRRGLFITVEGGEGAGKSTNLEFLRQQLADAGVDLLVTREPGGTAVGEEIREVLLRRREDGLADMTELLLIFAARAQHLHEVIEPALAAGRWVLCDRFTDATYAYQGGGRGMSRDAIQRLEELVQCGLAPDYTILFDVPVTTGMTRVRDRGATDRIEQENTAFFHRVRAAYLELAEYSSGRYRVVDASRGLAEVQAQLLKVGQELLSCWHVRHPAR